MRTIPPLCGIEKCLALQNANSRTNTNHTYPAFPKIYSTTTMKRKATRSLTEPEAKRAHHLVPCDVPPSLQKSLASKLELVHQHITSLTEPKADDREIDGEDDVEKSLVIKLSLAPRLLAAFPHEVSKSGM